MKRDSRQILTELLVLKAQGWDDRAFAELHDLWREDVRRMVRVAIGRAEDSTEVAQDTWIAVARGLPRLQDPACFPRWLFQIVRRRSADWVRRRQRERLARHAIIAQTSDTRDAAKNPSRPTAGNSTLAEIIANLATAERELLCLYYEVGRSQAEIAEILQVPVGTVKSRLHTLRERLRTQIESESS